MGESILIAVGNWKYKHEPKLNIPIVEDSVRKIADYFTGKLRYRRELGKISANPTSNRLLNTLDDWFVDSRRDSTDWIVLYYNGHGKLEPNGELYLLTSNYKNDRTPSTAFPVNTLSTMLATRNAAGQSRRAERVLTVGGVKGRMRRGL